MKHGHGGGATRLFPRDGDAEEFGENSSQKVGPRPKVWTLDQRSKMEVVPKIAGRKGSVSEQSRRRRVRSCS